MKDYQVKYTAKLKEAEKLAKQLISQFGLIDFTFKFDNAVSRFGYCSWSEKTISLSKNLVEMNSPEAIKDTILHEIAHGLTPHQGHNEVWIRVCKAIGGNGERCYDDDETNTPLTKWTAICPRCNTEILRMKKNKRLYCSKCLEKNGHRFAKDIKFRWSKNK